LRKTIENRLRDGRGNARPAIYDHQTDTAIRQTPAFDPHRAASRSMPQRIIHQIAEHFDQQFLDPVRARVGVGGRRQSHAAGLRRGLVDLLHLFHHAPQRNRREPRLQRPGFQPRQLQQLLDDPRQAIQFAQHRFQRFAVFRRRARAAQRHFAQIAHRRDRRAQLVRRVAAEPLQAPQRPGVAVERRVHRLGQDLRFVVRHRPRLDPLVPPPAANALGRRGDGVQRAGDPPRQPPGHACQKRHQQQGQAHALDHFFEALPERFVGIRMPMGVFHDRVDRRLAGHE